MKGMRFELICHKFLTFRRGIPLEFVRKYPSQNETQSGHLGFFLDIYFCVYSSCTMALSCSGVTSSTSVGAKQLISPTNARIYFFSTITHHLMHESQIQHWVASTVYWFNNGELTGKSFCVTRSLMIPGHFFNWKRNAKTTQPRP